MADVTIPDLTALGANTAVDDLLEIADISNTNASRKVTQAQLLQGLTITPTTGTLTLTNLKTLAVTNTLTLSGTDSTVMTFPTTSATIARTDAANTFTGASTATSWTLTTPVLSGTITGTYTIGGTPTWPSSISTGTLTATTGFTCATGGGFTWSTRSIMTAPADGSIRLTNNAQNDFTALQFGGTTSSFPAIKRNSAALNFRSADDSADCSITAATGTFSGSGIFPAATTSIPSIRLPHGTAPSAPTNGDMWTTTSALQVRINGSTVTLGSGSGDVVGPGSATDNAIVRFDSTTGKLVQDSVVTIADTTGDISTAGTLSVGVGGSTAGAMVLTQGTTQSTGTTNITLQAPAAVTSYIRTLPGAVGSTGFLLETVSGSVQTETLVAGTGSANVMRSTNPTLDAGALTLAENASIALDPAGSADGKYSGITVTGTGGATIAFGDLITLDKDDSRWELVDISVAAAATGDARGIMGIAVTSSTDGTAVTVLLQGIVRADANFPTLTIGAAVYASTTGDVVVTQPTTTDHVIRIVGYAMTADEMYFAPAGSWTTHT